jgi:hypothetical protein
MNTFQSFRYRVRSCLFIVSLCAGLIGTVVYFIQVATFRSSSGSYQFVLLPLAVAVMYGCAGAVWARTGREDLYRALCKTCGYSHAATNIDSVCSECGSAPCRPGRSFRTASLILALPTVLLYLLAVGFAGIALWYWYAWRSGWLGDI